MRFNKFFAVLGFLSLSITAARADYYVESNGGQIGAFVQQFAQMQQSGQMVRIRGDCLSACTIVLALPPHQVCAEPGARLGFHLAWYPDTNGVPQIAKAGSQLLYNLYTPGVKRWIFLHGGLAKKMKYLQGKELFALVHKCRGTDFAAAPGITYENRQVWSTGFGFH